MKNAQFREKQSGTRGPSLLVFLAVCIFLPVILEFFIPTRLGYIGIIYRFFTCTLIALCLSKGVKEESILNPYYFFLLTPISLLLYSDDVSTYYLLPLENKTWLISILNMFTFVAGIMIGEKKNYTPESIKKELWQETEYGKLLFVLILFALGLVPVVFQIGTGNSFPGGQLLLVMTYIAFTVGYRCNYKRISFFILILATLLRASIFFNKTLVLQMVLVVICSIEFSMARKSSRKKVYAIIASSIVFLLIISFSLKGYLAEGGRLVDFWSDFNADATVDRLGSRVNWDYNPLLLSPYFYFVTPWCNLQYVMNTITEHTYGLWLIKPLLGWLQLSDHVVAYSELESFRFAYNTFGFISVEYIDFGFCGSCLSSFLIGLFVGVMYKKVKICNTSTNVACYSLCAVAVLEMFFSNHFFMSSYPFTIVLAAWLFKKVAVSLR